MELVSRHRADSWSLARRRGCSRGGLQRRSGQDWPREGPRRRSFTALLLSFFDGGLVGRWMPSEAKPKRRMSAVAMWGARAWPMGSKPEGRRDGGASDVLGACACAISRSTWLRYSSGDEQ